jgi:hypothetical protein
MTETTQRFLRAIVERIPIERIVEVRLFPAIRQGGMESGVAVVAAVPAPPAVVAEEMGAQGETASPAEGDGQPGTRAAEPVSAIDVPTDGHRPADEDTDPAGAADTRFDGTETADAAGEKEGVEAAVPESATPMAGPASARASTFEREVEVPHGASPGDAAPGDAAEETIALDDILALPSPDGSEYIAATPPLPAFERFSVITARYRLTLKGPERGKWEMEVVHEADAPLDTVERVARGVARRAGEDADPAHLDVDALRHAITEPAWVTVT